ncbi:MAG: UbiA-like polyprenyltransferase [bacterium]
MVGKLWEYGRMIRFSHSIFLLPFALSALVLAPTEELELGKLFWILAALVSARSAAMGFNRIADRSLDLANPRTSARALPAGRITLGEAWAFVLISGAIFLFSALMLNPLAAILSPFALGFILAYSFTKRFTLLSHLWLGLGTAMAPAGVWVALTGSLGWEILILVGSVALWVAGFDVLYACQDVEFDRKWGLFSIPARMGVGRALWIARGLHGLCFLGFFWVGQIFSLGAIYLAGMCLVGILFVLEHLLVSEKDLSRINDAFFKVNGLVSVVFFLAVLADTWFKK